MEKARIVLPFCLACAGFAQQPAVSAGFSPIPTVTTGTIIPDDSQQFIFLGPTIRDLTVSYPANLVPGGAAVGRVAFTVKMLNLVKPILSTTVSVNSDRTYSYSFALLNDPSAGDAIKVWSIAMPAVDAVLTAAHSSWVSTQEPDSGHPSPPSGTVSMSPVVLATWSNPAGASVAAGASVSGYNINSAYLPGFTLIYARSDEDYAVPADLPGPVTAQMQVIRERDWMNARALGIGPRFPSAWSKDVIAADFKDGVTRLVATGVLSSSSKFVVDLLSTLDALIGAAGASVPVGPVVAEAATSAERNIANAISVSLQ